MAIETSFSFNVLIVLPDSFFVEFTDTTTGSPDSWLWDFGDGHVSLDQNPTHKYRGKWFDDLGTVGDFSTPYEKEIGGGEPVLYEVKLTAWKNGTLISDASWRTANAPIITRGVQSGKEFASFDLALAAFLATFPYTDWTDSFAIKEARYTFFKFGLDWQYTGKFSEMTFDLGAYPPSLYIAYFEAKISTIKSSNTTYFGTPLYDGHLAHSWKIGKWNSSSLSFDDREVFRIDELARTTALPCFDLGDHLGVSGDVSFRLLDGYEYQRALTNVTTSGYLGADVEVPVIWLWQVGSVDDKDTVTNIISVSSPSIITRPPVLYSGIKEAYFADGWENEKYFYVEQSSPYPCIIEFIDIYADATNE